MRSAVGYMVAAMIWWTYVTEADGVYNVSMLTTASGIYEACNKMTDRNSESNKEFEQEQPIVIGMNGTQAT